MKFILLIFFQLVNLCFRLDAQVSVTYNALPLTTVIRNPERGFYVHTEVYSKGTYQALSQSDLNFYKSQNYSIILRVFYLENFLNTSISTTFLTSIRNDFILIRSTGLKCVLRFAYSYDQTKVGSLDASKSQVLAHITQLKPILVEFADIIAVMQAGFIGTWGEWYYTDNFGYPTPSLSDLANRKAVFDSLLAALPTQRMIQIRTPSLKQKLYSSKIAITSSEAYTGSTKARIGHHNDCFLASSDDYGTYEDISIEYPYLEQETKYLAMGGETCAVNKPRSDCVTALAEMQKFHWSYLNIGYHPDVISNFRTQGCFTTIQNRLGYRIVLISSLFPKSCKTNSPISFQLKLNNTGFAAPFNPRKAYLVLKSNTSTYSFALNTKPNFWLPGALQTINESITLASVRAGDYKLYLNLPDLNSALSSRSDYSIRFANENLWDASTGYNNLMQTLTVT